MKILYVGAESANWVVSLCNEFCKMGHEVTCVVQQQDEYDKDNPVEKHENLERINMGFSEIQNPEKVKSRLVRQLSQDRPDIIFGSHAPIAPVIYNLAKAVRVPWGIMLLDIPKDLMMHQRGRMLQWVRWFDIMKYATTMIFNTEVARDVYEEYTNQHFGNSNIITYGTDLPEEYNFAGKDIKGDYVISICRLAPLKNCREIPLALKELENPPKYIAVGRDSGQLSEIKRLCEMHDIEFEHRNLVTQEEKFELIKNSLAVIYPQATEYIGGLSPWEGMYVGKPVICRDYKVLRDLYEDDVIYYDNSIGPLAKEIAWVRESKNPREVYKKKANHHARTEASFKTMAERMIKVFEGITG